jgi:hypothetical protein
VEEILTTIRRSTTSALAVAALAAALFTAGSVPADAHRQGGVTITPTTPRANFPKLTVTTRLPGRAPGFIFAGAKFDGVRPAGAPVGPMITDDRGRPVWFLNLPGGTRATDVRTQTYRGKRVLTYWQGGTGVNPGVGVGDDYILNQHYKVIRVVHGHGVQVADQHEFLLTPGNTAIIVSYHEVRADASAVGGSANQDVLDCVVQEIDLDTSQVVFEWHSLTHVPLKNSYSPAPSGQPDTPWDYFHINSVKIDTDHNLLISGRHTWAVYKVDRHSGKVLWRLGGKNPSFTPGVGTVFSWQHDAEAVAPDVYRIFDNHWNQVPPAPANTQSRVLYIRVDTTTHTATRVRRITYPISPGLLAGSQGNAQTLSNGDVFVGWGAADHISEFTPSGQMIFDATFPAGFNTYRAYRESWVGTPDSEPFIRIKSPGGNTRFDVLWNGASTVARWRLLGGSNPNNLTIIGTTPWNGYDTAFTLSSVPTFLRAVALNSAGKKIGRTGIRQTT